MFACWITAAGYVLWSIRKSRRDQLRLLHENLQQIGMAWSRTEATIKPAALVDYSKEIRREQKWLLVTGAVLSVASWLGFLVLCTLIVSLEKIAMPRLEKALFNTDLVRRRLPAEDVRSLLHKISPE